MDKTGLTRTYAGEIPSQCAALKRARVNVQELTLGAALEGNRARVHHAVVLDSLAAAILTMDEIWAMTDDLVAPHGEALPERIRG